MRSYLQSGLAAAVLLGLVACDRDGADFMPLPIDGVPGVVDFGVVDAIPMDEFSSSEAIFHTLGPPELGVQGGSTLSFIANGNNYCIVVDPETVFWNQAMSSTATGAYLYPDLLSDDGDIDMEVGLSAYYTGSPGLEQGTFEQIYEDSLGNQVSIEFNECIMTGYQNQIGAHAGRGTPESCVIETAQHPNREYMISLNTWSLPRDDNQLSYAVAVIDVGATGDCTAVFGTGDLECGLRAEASGKDYFGSDGPDGGLEQAFCEGTQSDWCIANPDYCGEL